VILAVKLPISDMKKKVTKKINFKIKKNLFPNYKILTKIFLFLAEVYKAQKTFQIKINKFLIMTSMMAVS